ncbi:MULTISPECIES: MFS transporter [unclassified Nonomuraea]|uniref:MFS transporter n=1 Tax=unclassified Nonomuraea TaxID=2593643 RepID=UPI0033E7FC20
MPRTEEALPVSLRRLFLTVPFVGAAAPLAYAVSGYFLPIQVQAIDNGAKVGNLALINTLSACAAMVAQPVIGLLSDRTRTRYGARTPWMVAGAAVGVAALLLAGRASTVALLIAAMTLVQFGFNAFQGPLGAIMPDRVPTRLRGRYSTLIGLGQILGAILGPVLASLFVSRIPAGYATFAVVVLAVILLFVVINRDPGNLDLGRPPFSAVAFFTAFWVSPARHPDFFWALLGRFLIFGGYYMALTYGFYIAQDYLGLGAEEAARLTPLLGLAGLPGFLVAIVVSGPLSDRLGRRKPLTLIGGLIISLSALIPLLMPTVTGMFLSAIVATIGFGVFISVDQALVSEILPSRDDFAKDLGVLNLAATLPNTVAPAAAGAVVSAFGGYGPLYGAVTIVTVLGALAVLLIRGVR